MKHCYGCSCIWQLHRLHFCDPQASNPSSIPPSEGRLIQAARVGSCRASNKLLQLTAWDGLQQLLQTTAGSALLGKSQGVGALFSQLTLQDLLSTHLQNQRRCWEQLERCDPHPARCSNSIKGSEGHSLPDCTNSPYTTQRFMDTLRITSPIAVYGKLNNKSTCGMDGKLPIL